MSLPVLSLEEIREQVEQCQSCSLWEGRTHVVFGEGDPHARVMIVGEAPGKNEDLQGRPFVGAAGKFLDELLEAAGLPRESVFIANVLKCRPQSNRNPQANEIQACAPFLRLQTRKSDQSAGYCNDGQFCYTIYPKNRYGHYSFAWHYSTGR